MLCDGHKGTKALIDHSLPPDGISLPPLSDHPPPGQGWEQRNGGGSKTTSTRERMRSGSGWSERNGGGSKTTSTRERTPSGSELERAQRRRIEDDIHSRAHAVRLGAGASATAADRRRHPLASARRQARGWSERNGGGSKTTSTRERTPSGSGLERAQRRRIEDDIHSRAHAVRLGAGASATAAGRRRHPLAGARRQARGWE